MEAIVVSVTWMVIGLVASYVMGRRGHNPFGWWFLGAVFGPLVLALAIDAAHRRRMITDMVGEPGSPGHGPVDVLVGIDGSPHARAALHSVCELLGPRLGRLTLAAVVSYESAGRTAGDRAEAVANLEREAPAVTACRPDRVILSGPAAQALVEYAAKGRYDLVALGTRGRGLSNAVLGSVASQLVRQAQIPVLVAGEPA